MNNLTVNNHLNQWDRPIAELVRGLGVRLRDTNAQYHVSGGAGDIVYAIANGGLPNDPIVDGRSEAEGLPVITANDFLEFETDVVEAIQAICDAKSTLIQKFCVRSLEVL